MSREKVVYATPPGTIRWAVDVFQIDVYSYGHEELAGHWEVDDWHLTEPAALEAAHKLEDRGHAVQVREVVVR